MTKQEKAALKTAAARLRALIDPASEDCCIAAEHKNAVRLYVETWILPVVTAAATDPSKRDRNDKSNLEHAEQDRYQLT